MFVRAKRLNSGTNDPSFATRVRANSGHLPHVAATPPLQQTVSTIPSGGSASYASNTSLVSYLSNSDLLNGHHNHHNHHVAAQRTVSHRSSQISLVRNDLLNHHHHQQQQHSTVLQGHWDHQSHGAFATPPRNEPVLSSEAAKHRIAVKPKNRRPKSFQPTVSGSLASWRVEKGCMCVVVVMRRHIDTPC